MDIRSKRVAVLVAAIAALTLFAACGGGDEGTPRSFDNDASNPAPKPPKNVATDVNLSYKKGKFHVDVSADRDYCVDGRTVAILEEGKRKDVKVGKVSTDDEGLASQAEKKAAGKFVAVVSKEPSAKYGDLSVCLGARSKSVKV